jgi:hypothetical protein
LGFPQNVTFRVGTLPSSSQDYFTQQPFSIQSC